MQDDLISLVYRAINPEQYSYQDTKHGTGQLEIAGSGETLEEGNISFYGQPVEISTFIR